MNRGNPIVRFITEKPKPHVDKRIIVDIKCVLRSMNCQEGRARISFDDLS